MKPSVSLAADIVVFAPRDNDLCVLLIKRGNEPHKGAWALPGGGVEAGETSHDAAVRELEEETGLTMTTLSQIGVYDRPDRDPRGRVVSVVYSAIEYCALDAMAGDDAAEVQWVPVDAVLQEAVPLAFDHLLIVADAVSKFYSS
jgi:8-oxo-dGTP diphosphatase